MLYAMNTRTMVPTDSPMTNDFGHEAGCTFVYLRNPNGKFKVWVTYGDPQLVVGQRVEMTNDTGLGHRSMPDHVVVAVMNADGNVGGKLPEQRKIALWVAK